VLFASGLTLVFSSDDSDPVLEFYLRRAQHAFDSRDPARTGTSYSFRAKCYYKHVGDGGEIARVDSAEIDYFYSWGKLDSQKTVSGNVDLFKDLDLTYPRIFDQDYNYNLFPNDTGGRELAIGFDTDSLNDPKPVGVVLIDRELYYPLWLYLSYPHQEGYVRFSRAFRFTVEQGRLFPDSLWEVGAKAGVFFSEHYRLETGITDITVYP
jgi:hypothetical protein